MKGMMSMMAGGDVADKQAALREMQQQMLDPSARMPKAKGSTGKRLTTKERDKLKKDRERKLKQKRKGGA